jgi:hypothetical protein
MTGVPGWTIALILEAHTGVELFVDGGAAQV